MMARLLRISFCMLLFAAGWLFVNCSAPLPFVSAADHDIAYSGRVLHERNDAVLFWAGSSVALTFTGPSVRADISDEKGDNCYYVIIDSSAPVKLKPAKGRDEYTLAGKLPGGSHHVTLFKLTDVSHGKTLFYGFRLGEGGTVLPAGPPPVRSMEFYGNSITSGYALEDSVADSNGAVYCNNYLSYAALTARHYHAGYSCISKSGIGVMISWFPIIMPELYDRLDPDDSVHKWDFSQYTPGIVVVDLLQNDSWLVNKPGHKQFKARFGTTPPGEADIIAAYRNFIQSVRGRYPKASIVCTLGSMDATKEGSPWPGYVQKAVAAMNDRLVYTCFFPFKQSMGHPKVREQQAIADSLISFIDRNVQW